MTLQQLQYFLALAEIKHYTKTAASLHISQPSLSYAISELEKELHVRLFERTSRKIELSDAGRRFYEKIDAAMNLIQSAVDELKMPETSELPVLRVGYIHSIGNTLIPQFMDLMHEPGAAPVKISFTQALDPALIEQLENGKLDLIFSVTKATNGNSTFITRQPLCLYVSDYHPLSERDEVSLKDIGDENLILVDKQSQLRRQVETSFRNIHRIPRISLEANNCTDVLNYVSKGYGIAILPKTFIGTHPNVKELRFSDPDLSRGIYVSRSPHFNYPQNVADTLASVIKAMCDAPKRSESTEKG